MQQRNIQQFWSSQHSGCKIYQNHKKKNTDLSIWLQQLFLCAHRCSTEIRRSSFKLDPHWRTKGWKNWAKPQAIRTSKQLLFINLRADVTYITYIYIYSWTGLLDDWVHEFIEDTPCEEATRTQVLGRKMFWKVEYGWISKKSIGKSWKIESVRFLMVLGIKLPSSRVHCICTGW